VTAFEWDEEKNNANFIKHGIRFETAGYIFEYPLRIERPDKDSSDVEERLQTIGCFKDILFVVYTERGEVTRIISARQAEPFERRIYHGNSDTYPYGWQRSNP